MLFSYGSGRQRMEGNNKCRQIDGYFDCHGNAAVGRGAHRPMELFTTSASTRVLTLVGKRTSNKSVERRFESPNRRLPL
jgi:hypothetical protein